VGGAYLGRKFGYPSYSQPTVGLGSDSPLLEQLLLEFKTSAQHRLLHL